MRALLLGLAAAVALPAPALAVDPNHQVFVGTPAPTVHNGVIVGGDRSFRRNRNSDGTVLIYDRDYQGNSSWKSDSFNDWWHEQPERAYPRWMLSNQNCEKQWYQGSVLRC